MADNFNRMASPGPLLISGSASTSTQIEVMARPGGIPQTGDADANPYTTSGQTRIAILVGGDLMSQNVGGQKVALGPWIAVNLATNTSQTMNLGAQATAPETSVPYPGSVLGLAVNLQTHLTAGALSGWVTKNGTSIAATVVTFGTVVGTLYKAMTQNKDVATLVAGDRIGVKLTSTAAMAPTTNDWAAYVYVDQ